MPRRKIPLDALSFYFGLGPERSYEKVAAHYGASKRAVTNLAVKERWQGRLQELEQKARERANEKALNAVDAMNERHLKAARVVQAKGLEALRSIPLDSALSAVRAIDLGIRQERLILGEPSERTAVSVEEIIKREYERWMVPVDDGAPAAEGEALPLEEAPGNSGN